MFIAHLMHSGPRAAPMITEGLLELGCNFVQDRDTFSRGTLLMPRTLDVLRRLDEYNLIICGNQLYIELLTAQRAWDRVVWYDFEDSCAVSPAYGQARLYFKRSVVHPDRSPAVPADVLHLDYSVLDTYLLNYANMESQPRTIPISCFFNVTQPANTRRGNLVRELAAAAIPGMHLGATGGGSETANAISKTNAAYGEYLRLLRSSRIVFTAFHDQQDGDSRTWEALASGALVFRDQTYIQSPHPLIDGVHFIGYDATQPANIRSAIAHARDLLSRGDELQRIAEAGCQHVLAWHRSVNRVQFMLDQWKTTQGLPG